MIETKEQIYGRNDMVMLDKHNKIYGSLGIAEQYVFNTAEGNPAILRSPIAGKAEDVITQFEMQGWTEQNRTTGVQLFDKSTAIQNSYVSDNTGAEGYSDKSYASDYISVLGIDSLRCTNTASETYMSFYDSEKAYISGKNVYEKAIQVPENAVYARFTIINSFIDTFMVNAGQTLLPYEPYTGNKPSPSPDYPQPITNAGKYNEDTGKWEYEITITNEQTDPDKNQTVTLTADRPLTKWDKLEKRNGQWGWVYKSAEIKSYTDESVPGEYYSTTGQLSVGAQVWYETATETFVPLSPEEQEQMNELTMNVPTTVISNNVKANMKITYKATQT